MGISPSPVLARILYAMPASVLSPWAVHISRPSSYSIRLLLAEPGRAGTCSPPALSRQERFLGGAGHRLFPWRLSGTCQPHVRHVRSVGHGPPPSNCLPATAATSQWGVPNAALQPILRRGEEPEAGAALLPARQFPPHYPAGCGGQGSPQ